MNDSILGELVPDEHIKNFYSATYQHRGVDLTVYIDPDRSELDVTMSEGRKGLLDLDRIEKRARKEASAKLLDTYNESWREYQESDGQGGWTLVSNPAITAEEFESRLTLDTVTITGEGDLSLGFLDGDLFAGHIVEVSSMDGSIFNDLHATISG